MSTSISAATGHVYGVERTCDAFGVARSSFYARRARSVAQPAAAPSGRRGPRPQVTDADLLARIRNDLATSPFRGEGHRKVWARLRVRDGVRVARKRVLRLMRENRLLSPHRVPQGEPRAHDGTITTDAPNVMWGTDGARVFTVNDGWVWVFIAVEHWNWECVGWHVAKCGSRYAALEPIAMGVNRIFGSVAAGAARGLALRMDHGTQYLSDHFLNQIKAWGIAPSFAFLAEPETNGVAERFVRQLKEQAVYGRVFLGVEDLRVAVRKFVDDFNREWRVEKRGFQSPADARAAHKVSVAA